MLRARADLGPEVFRTGVRDYLETHKSTMPTPATCGQPSGARASADPRRDGRLDLPTRYPVVTVSRDAGGHLVLAQQRFNYLREPLPPAVPDPEQPWQVPIQLRVHGGRLARGAGAPDQPEARLRLARPRTLCCKRRGHGFYRVRYSPDLLEALLNRLDMLAPIERFNLVNERGPWPWPA